MGWEYWIANTARKELFYLGCGNWSFLSGLNSCVPAVISYEDPKEIVVELVEQDLLDGDDTLAFAFHIANLILEFCEEDEVMVINDSDRFTQMLEEYEETKDINKITKYYYHYNN